MHSYIFQIYDERIDEDCWIDGDSFDCPDKIDYTSEIDEEERLDAIKRLVEAMPEGLFKLEGDDVLVYQGGYVEVIEKWLKKVKNEVNSLTVQNAFVKDFEIKHLISNPLNTDFYLFSWEFDDYPRYSELVAQEIKGVKPGDKLYIGGVLDYHY